MPKVSQEHVEARKRQILDGARRTFARHGYEGATVARLEKEIGLSRGAIFNYYDDKLSLFQALAGDDSRRWLSDFGEAGIDGVLRQIAGEDPAWARVYLDVLRKAGTDPEFARRMEAHEPEPEQRAAGRQLEELQHAGVLRDDVDRKAIANLINLLSYGLLMYLILGEEVDLDALLRLVHEGVDPRK
jgi:TetR/AcrR family transcriptional regulator, transcriptional repressor of aconitase